MRTEAAAALLRRTRLFAELHEGTLAALADRSVERSHPRHARLFHQGDPGSGLYVLASGLVKVMVTSDAHPWTSCAAGPASTPCRVPDSRSGPDRRASG
jgi:hypothetical protein